MVKARKLPGASSGKYSDRLEQVFKPGLSRASIWSISGSDAEPTGEENLEQVGSQSEGETEGDSMKEDSDKESYEQNWSVVPQGASRTHSNKVPNAEYSRGSLELALVCMADLDNRLTSTENSLENQHCWNENMHRCQANTQTMMDKLCTDIEAINTRLAAIEEKMSTLWTESGKDGIAEAPQTMRSRRGG